MPASLTTAFHLIISAFTNFVKAGPVSLPGSTPWVVGVSIEHIPYKGAAPATNDLLGGHIPIMFDTLPTVLPAVGRGNIRVLAVTSLRRAPSLPDVPTLDEAGVKGFEAIAWFCLSVRLANSLFDR